MTATLQERLTAALDKIAQQHVGGYTFEQFEFVQHLLHTPREQIEPTEELVATLERLALIAALHSIL